MEKEIMLLIMGLATPIGIFLGFLFTKNIVHLKSAFITLAEVLFYYLFAINAFVQYWKIETSGELVVFIGLFFVGVVVLEVIRKKVQRTRVNA